METAAFGEGETAGAVGCSPRQGALQMKPATSSCRAFCAASTHGRWPRPGGSGARYGRQLETAAFVGAKPPGAVGCSPRQGAWQAKPATSSCRAFCAISTHGRWPRPRDGGARKRPAVGNCGLHLRNRRGGWVQPPLGGLADEARNFQLPGVLCDFHPRTMAAAEGRWGSTRPAVGNCGLR